MGLIQPEKHMQGNVKFLMSGYIQKLTFIKDLNVGAKTI